MARFTTVFVALVVFLATAQCFAMCLEGACHQKHSCHSKVKACLHQDLIAEDSVVSTAHSPRVAAVAVPVARTTAPVLPTASFKPKLPISLPSVESHFVAVLKI